MSLGSGHAKLSNEHDFLCTSIHACMTCKPLDLACTEQCSGGRVIAVLEGVLALCFCKDCFVSGRQPFGRLVQVHIHASVGCNSTIPLDRSGTREANHLLPVKSKHGCYAVPKHNTTCL